jgi:hypothetical protein
MSGARILIRRADAPPHLFRGSAHNLLNHFISQINGLGQCGTADLTDIVRQTFLSNEVPARDRRLSRLLPRSPGGWLCLPKSRPYPTPAARSRCRHLQETDFHTRRSRTAKNATFVHAAAADTGPWKYAQHAARPLPCSACIFAKNSGIHVVADHGRTFEPLRQEILQIHILPAQIRSFQNDAFLQIQRPGNTRTNPADFFCRPRRLPSAPSKSFLPGVRAPLVRPHCPASFGVFSQASLSLSSNTTAIIFVPPRSKPTQILRFGKSVLMVNSRP